MFKYHLLRGKLSSPAVPTRSCDVSNKLTGRNAARPARNPAVFSASPIPIDVTIPAPVITTGRVKSCLGLSA